MHTQIILDDVPRGILGPLEDALHGDFPKLSLFFALFRFGKVKKIAKSQHYSLSPISFSLFLSVTLSPFLRRPGIAGGLRRSHQMAAEAPLLSFFTKLR